MKKKIIGTIMTVICSLSLTTSAFAAPSGLTTTSKLVQFNQGYSKQTTEEKAASDKKSKLADDYVLSKKSSSAVANATSSVLPQTAGGSKINLVGHFRQEYNYSCGAASAKNLISGYTQKNGGNSPAESTLRDALHTSSSGTDFTSTYWQPTLNTYAPGDNYTLTWAGSTWTTSLANKVIYTIDKANNYNVILDLNHGAISDPIRPEYANGISHYVCDYGYNDASKIYYISDSYSAVPQTYTCTYQSAADSTQQRGCIW